MPSLSRELVVALSILLPCGFILYRFLSSPLRKVPGPTLARFSRLWYLFSVRRGRFEQENVELHAKYGKIVRIAPNEYSIADPDAIKTMYGRGTQFRKSDWYTAWEVPHMPNQFSSKWTVESIDDLEICTDMVFSLF